MGPEAGGGGLWKARDLPRFRLGVRRSRYRRHRRQWLVEPIYKLLAAKVVMKRIRWTWGFTDQGPKDFHGDTGLISIFSWGANSWSDNPSRAIHESTGAGDIITTTFFFFTMSERSVGVQKI